MLKMTNDGELFSEDFDLRLVEQEDPLRGDLVPGSAYWYADRFYTMQRLQAAQRDMCEQEQMIEAKRAANEENATRAELERNVMFWNEQEDNQAALKEEGIRQYLAMATGSLETRDQRLIAESYQGMDVTYGFDPYMAMSEEEEALAQARVDTAISEGTVSAGEVQSTKSPGLIPFLIGGIILVTILRR